jgi:hypothetical protein
MPALACIDHKSMAVAMQLRNGSRGRTLVLHYAPLSAVSDFAAPAPTDHDLWPLTTLRPEEPR